MISTEGTLLLKQLEKSADAITMRGPVTDGSELTDFYSEFGAKCAEKVKTKGYISFSYRQREDGEGIIEGAEIKAVLMPKSMLDYIIKYIENEEFIYET